MSQLLYNYFGINADGATSSDPMSSQPHLADQSITVGLGSAGSLLLSPFLALLPFMPVAVPLVLLFLSKLELAPCICGNTVPFAPHGMKDPKNLRTVS